MNKILLAALIVLIAVGILFLTPHQRPEKPAGSQASLVVFHTKTGDVSVSVEIADTPRGREVGLMNRTYLPEDAGMLFVFDQQAVVYFWMKNTLIPLDMIFISENMTVVHIERTAQPCRSDPCPLYPSVAPVRYVVEVNGGFAESHGIMLGTMVKFVNVYSGSGLENPPELDSSLGK